MTQNKSVEEVVEEFNDRSNDRMFLEDECKNSFWFEEGEDVRYDQDEASKWLTKEFNRLLQQERQTSQERERDIVEMINAKRPQQYMGRVSYMEGYDNAIDDILAVIKTYQP